MFDEENMDAEEPIIFPAVAVSLRRR